MRSLGIVCLLIVLLSARPAVSAVLRVPRDHDTIQTAIDASQAGDTILVGPGRYQERIRLKPGVILRSTGNDANSDNLFHRAEVTIIDGNVSADSPQSGLPGVTMAESSTLDGFTITNVGNYDEERWQRHFESQGEELGDGEGAMQAEGSVPAVRVQEVACTVTHCIVHHNGDVGIGVLGKSSLQQPALISQNLVYRNMGGGIGLADGADAVVQGNTCRANLRAGIGCRNASPLVSENVCSENVRAGIGCREGSKPVLRGNQCYQNRRAGIGIRMEGTAPVVEANECWENEMAGIGCRDKASPVLRDNRCHHNKMAGIGCRGGASPVILGNECRENQMAGIGLEEGVTATIQGNRCIENRLVAIGVTGRSHANVLGNLLSRADGVPPILAVKEESTALIRDNEIRGGGVAAVLVQGTVTLVGNRFQGLGAKQGNAIWVWQQGEALIADNRIDGYRTAVTAKDAELVIAGNHIRGFQGAAISIKSGSQSVHVMGNRASSRDPRAILLESEGRLALEADNELQRESVEGEK